MRSDTGSLRLEKCHGLWVSSLTSFASRFIVLNLVIARSFIRILCKLVKISVPKLANISTIWVPKRDFFPWRTFFFVFGKFVVPYFHENVRIVMKNPLLGHFSCLNLFVLFKIYNSLPASVKFSLSSANSAIALADGQ